MTEKPAPASKNVKGDDRNLVAAEATPAAPALDQVLLTFWEKNRSIVIGVVIGALLVVLGREGWRSFQASQETRRREEFGAATTLAQRLEFARKHEGHALAGVALLAAADEAYSNGDFVPAGQHYAAAVAALQEPVLAGRARLGEGMSALQAGVESKGAEILGRLGDDAAVEKAIRIEALYHLASRAVAAGDHAAARTSLDKLDALEPTGMWAGRAMGLRSRLPADESAEAPAVSLPGS